MILALGNDNRLFGCSDLGAPPCNIGDRQLTDLEEPGRHVQLSLDVFEGRSTNLEALLRGDTFEEALSDLEYKIGGNRILFEDRNVAAQFGDILGPPVAQTGE